MAPFIDHKHGDHEQQGQRSVDLPGAQRRPGMRVHRREIERPERLPQIPDVCHYGIPHAERDREVAQREYGAAGSLRLHGQGRTSRGDGEQGKLLLSNRDRQLLFIARSSLSVGFSSEVMRPFLANRRKANGEWRVFPTASSPIAGARKER